VPDLHHDIETGSALDLSKVGAWVYAEHSSTIVRCLAFAVDDGPVQTWLPPDPPPEAFTEAWRDPSWRVYAHNAAFERVIAHHILIRRHNFPEIPLARWRCTMAMALASALPAKLEKLADVLGLAHRKTADGPRLIKRMCFPRPDGTFDDDPEWMQRLIDRCRQDVEIERDVHHRLPELSGDEQKIWMLDAVINARGFYTDSALLEAAAHLGAGFDQAIQTEIAEITAGAVTSTTQVAKLQAWLAGRGCEIKDATKGTLKAALRRKALDPAARRAIELRLGAAFDTKCETMIERRSADRRVRGCLQFHGAGTGRWAARGVQVQNFTRDPGDVDMKIAAIMAGDMRGYDQPLGAIADAARGAICAAPGSRFLIGDFSGIESRVLAWIAEETAKLEQWRRFDATGDPKDEPYFILGKACGMPDERARQGKYST
jgi:DNA polymerase